jgi:rhodanese-related sulfurtransferase
VAAEFPLSLEALRERLQADPELSSRLAQGGVIVSCQTGQRAHIASRMLVQKGFQGVKVLSGSFLSYSIAAAMVQRKA